MKQRIPKAIYSKEFREAAVRQVTEEGISAKEAARRLSLPHSTLSGWVKAARMGTLGEIGKTQRQLSEAELELAKVKRELAEVKMERDLLKKAAAYFAKGSR
jgi:transposase